MSKTSVALLLILWLTSTITSQGVTSAELNKTISLTIASRKNQTGHFISQAAVNSDGHKVPNHWKMEILQSNYDHSGIQSFRLAANFVAPPPLPADYQLFPGVGYYKFHTTVANGFEDASLQCAMEGGHLAILNSESEHQVLQTMFARYPESQLKHVWAFVGFHDRDKEGEFYTIFGQPLQSSGFTRWSHPGQPDDAGKAEDCGTIHRNGGINDFGCGGKIPFFCEYDLSWAEY
ncbi:hemolymph lipopolysaccharide-binding protein-like [Hetaerina americana]|uniref:hemolymph lipopolysaccharide-binding protein-like n=1 Tax=Hetaerina americana TaxID=62018 RepID=UPI003A7F147A